VMNNDRLRYIPESNGCGYKPIVRNSLVILIVFCMLIGLTSCQQKPSNSTGSGLKVIATNSLIGDVVSQVGGDKVSVDVLLPLGSDPHSFSPTPQDAAKIADADIVFANGVGLEAFLKPLMDNIGGSSKVVEVSEGINYRTTTSESSRDKQSVDDPHTWMDPNNVIIWVNNIVRALSEQDPINASYYLENGQAYQAKLRELDTWIRSVVSLIPEQGRKLVTDHLIFGYFSDRYGFSQLGAIIPGFSSLAEPSAQDIAQIEDAIKAMGVKAIFVNIGTNTSIAQRISDDTGTKLVSLYMHSLSDKGGEAGNYIDFMRYDVKSIINVLK
jgi:ABC-type Zn uptake system ZnuABC Zn-binding protein ZnuA